MSEFGIKELYSVVLKTTYPIEIDGKVIEAGEVVASFDKIQLSIMNENKKFITAHGGYEDTPRVFWETTEDLNLTLTQGIFSKMQLALMSNSRLLTVAQDESVLISKREKLESDENSIIHLLENPQGKVFVYMENGEKIGSIEGNGRDYQVDSPYMNVIVDYTYKYTNPATRMVIGQRLINGFLTLEGKTKVKDDITGHTKTGIFYIPKLKLMSELSMRLGENATPVLGRLKAKACPSGQRGSSRVMELVFLDNDIDSDM